jgi:Flp pilus assembly protein TadD
LFYVKIKKEVLLRRFVIILLLVTFVSVGIISSELYDEESYKTATEKMESGDIENSLLYFKKMLNLSEKEIWTEQVLLICDDNDILPKVNLLKKSFDGPILLIKRAIDSKGCLRLCAGVFRTRKESQEIAKSLPSPFKEAKPYPLQLVKDKSYTELAFGMDKPEESKPLETVENEANEKANVETKPEPKIELNKSEEKSSTETDLKNYKPSDLGESYFLKGIESYNKKDFSSAEKFFRQSITLNPQRYEAYNNLAIVLLEQRKVDEARKVLEEAVSMQPNYANTRANLSGVYWLLGKKDEAIKEAQRAYRLDSHDYRYSLNLASFLYESQRYDEALTYINVAKIVSPDNQDILSLEKQIKEKLGIAEKTEEKKEENKDKVQNPEKTKDNQNNVEEDKPAKENKGIFRFFKKKSK